MKFSWESFKDNCKINIRFSTKLEFKEFLLKAKEQNLIICSENEYKAFDEGDSLFCNFGLLVLTTDELIAKCTDDIIFDYSDIKKYI